MNLNSEHAPKSDVSEDARDECTFEQPEECGIC